MISREIDVIARRMANILADKVADKVVERLGFNAGAMMTRKEAAEFIGYSESYVKKLNIPTYKIGRKALYKKEDLTAFLTAKAERERSLRKR